MGIQFPQNDDRHALGSGDGRCAQASIYNRSRGTLRQNTYHVLNITSERGALMAQIPEIKKKNGFFSLAGFRTDADRLATSLIARDTVRPTTVAPSTLITSPAAQPVTTQSSVAAPAIGRAKRAGLGIGERQLLQVLSDALVVGGGALLILSLSQRRYDPGALFLSLGVICILWFFFADAFDAYKMPVIQTTFKSGYTATKVLVLTVGSYLLIAWLLGGSLPVIRPRIREALEITLLMVPLLAERTLISTLLTRAPLRRRVAVVGANRDGLEMGEALARYDGKTYEFLGYFDDSSSSSPMIDSHVPHPAVRNRHGLAQLVRPTSELLSVNQNVGIDQVVLANPNQTVHLLNSLSLLHERGVQITPMFAIYQDLTGRVPVSHLGDHWYVALPAHVKKTNRSYMIVKRMMDIVMALGMLAVTVPLMPLVALAIKLDSSGPVFFKQTRVGRGGKLFKIVKFRTMRHDAEAQTGAVWAADSDPRITRIGRLLRKSRLDEVPQLWNVIVGDMSFVGPRPERPEFDEELGREIPFYRARRAVRPGLTGWAQVNHGYGNTLLDALRKVEYDLYYIKNESLYLDLLILLRTVAVVLTLGGT
jgi:exopolysaccharide biosynthesis polyprenyl glycosylphosphotransferase